MKKGIISIAIAIGMLITSVVTVFAVTYTVGTTETWNYSTYEHHSRALPCPKSISTIVIMRIE